MLGKRCNICGLYFRNIITYMKTIIIVQFIINFYVDKRCYVLRDVARNVRKILIIILF